MSRESRPLLILLALVLVAGLLIGRWAWPGPAEEGDGFRSWFWHSRSPDLVVQAGLILCGALGIAALLPEDGKEDE